MAGWRRRTTALVMAVLLVGAACSGSDGGDEAGAPTDDGTAGDVGTNTDLDADFDVTTLPDDFPTQLLPASFTAGMYAELGNVRNVNFETSDSFDDVVARITAKLGEEPAIAEGEERLASWTVGTWLVSVIDSSPTLIGFASAE